MTLIKILCNTRGDGDDDVRSSLQLQSLSTLEYVFHFAPSIPLSVPLPVCLSVFLGPVMSTVRPHLYMYVDVCACLCVCAPRAERSVNSIIFIFHLSFKLSRVVVVVTVALVVVNSM